MSSEPAFITGEKGWVYSASDRRRMRVPPAGWQELAERLPVLIHQELSREFGHRRYAEVRQVTVNDFTTRFLADPDSGPAATCAEEAMVTVLARVSGEGITRSYFYRRLLAEYAGNRAGGCQFGRI